MQKTKSADEKRMDWLQKHVPRLDVKSGKVWVCWGYTANRVSSGKTLRQAVDNGIKQEKKINEKSDNKTE